MHPEVASVAFIIAALAFYRGEPGIGIISALVGLFLIGAFEYI